MSDTLFMETTTKTMEIQAAGVLAGAYRGKDLDDRALLQHAVCNMTFQLGRLVRQAGEALCNRKINLVDSVVWEPASSITCPKCREIAARIEAQAVVTAPGKT